MGLRASMPMWASNPERRERAVQRARHRPQGGVRHRHRLRPDRRQTCCDFPLYDPIDDNDIEAYRRWFPFTDFGVPPPVPLQFDERFYALRRGLGSWVASPSTEIADDLFAARLGVRQRWQTKRGPVGNQRIVDWITLDTDATIFPDAEPRQLRRDVGLVDYDFRWHVGDRTTLVSDGYFDFFDQRSQVLHGRRLPQPPAARPLYMGFRSLEGPITSNVLATSATATA